MVARVDIQRTYTIEEFKQLPDDGRRYELREGHLLMMSPTKKVHNIIASILHGEIYYYLKQNELGMVIQEGGFISDKEKNTILVPDISFISATHMPQLETILADLKNEDDYHDQIPDLAIEVLSDDNRYGKGKVAFDQKIRDYYRLGVRLIWIIDPKQKTVTILHSAELAPLILNIDAELDGEDVIPGFILPVLILFQGPRKNLK